MVTTTNEHLWDLRFEGRTLRVGLHEPPSVIECYDLLDEVDEQLPYADVLVLEGAGWVTERTRKTAHLLRDLAVEHGVEFGVEAASLRSRVVRI